MSCTCYSKLSNIRHSARMFGYLKRISGVKKGSWVEWHGNILGASTLKQLFEPGPATITRAF